MCLPIWSIRGPGSLLMPLQDVGLDAGKLVLSPTRTYAPVIREILKQAPDKIDGMIHCSGGAQTKVLHFADKVHISEGQAVSGSALV